MREWHNFRNSAHRKTNTDASKMFGKTLNVQTIF